jgi:L-lactate dehydrogenase
LTVSSVQDQVQGVRDVALSLPQVVGRAGILQTLHPPLDSAEQQALAASAQIISEHVAGLVLN